MMRQFRYIHDLRGNPQIWAFYNGRGLFFNGSGSVQNSAFPLDKMLNEVATHTHTYRELMPSDFCYLAEFAKEYNVGVAALTLPPQTQITTRTSVTTERCSDCNGSGEYRGLLEVDICRACGGKGRIGT